MSKYKSKIGLIARRHKTAASHWMGGIWCWCKILKLNKRHCSYHSLSQFSPKQLAYPNERFTIRQVYATPKMMTCGWNFTFSSKTIREWKKWAMARGGLIWIRAYKILAHGLFSAECRLLWTLQSIQLKLGSRSRAEKEKKKLLVSVLYKCIRVCLLIELYFIFSSTKCEGDSTTLSAADSPTLHSVSVEQERNISPCTFRPRRASCRVWLALTMKYCSVLQMCFWCAAQPSSGWLTVHFTFYRRPAYIVRLN